MKKIIIYIFTIVLSITSLQISVFARDDSSVEDQTKCDSSLSCGSNKEIDDPFIRVSAEENASYNDTFMMDNVEYAVFNANDLDKIYFVAMENLNETNIYNPIKIRKPRRLPCIPGSPGYPGCANVSEPESKVPERYITDIDGFARCLAIAILEDLGIRVGKSILTYFAKQFSFKTLLRHVASKFNIGIYAIFLAYQAANCYTSTSRPA